MSTMPTTVATATTAVASVARRTTLRTVVSSIIRTPSPSTRRSVRRGWLAIGRVDIYGKPLRASKPRSRMTRPAIPDLHASAYGRAWRLARAALVATSRLCLPALLVLVVVATDPPITPPVLRRLVTVVALVPALAAWAVRRALATEVEVRGDGLLVQRRDRRLEIPLAAIADVTPWTVPLPGPGLSFRMRSGRRLAWGIEAADPTPLVHALDEAGVAGARAASAHPVVVYACARAGISRPLLDHPLVKFALFPLAPAAILFYTHQHIAYGAFLGEYYLLGPGAYLADAVE